MKEKALVRCFNESLARAIKAKLDG